MDNLFYPLLCCGIICVDERGDLMELSEKIQNLRKERGLTQEQFARQLFVSRTAVSKWETGRGIPSMESLQMIAKLCGVTLDELLCAEEAVTIAKRENKAHMHRIDAVCNISAVIGLLLPLYKLEWEGGFRSVPLYQLAGWLSVLYWIFPAAMAICGIVQLVTNRKLTELMGTVINVCIILLLILSGQPYPAVLFLALFVIKGATRRVSSV